MEGVDSWLYWCGLSSVLLPATWAVSPQGVLIVGESRHDPPKLRQWVLEALHIGQPRIIQIKVLAQSYVWQAGLDKAIEDWVNSCLPCQESRPEMSQAPIHSWEYLRAPWLQLHTDFAGPFQGHVSLLIIGTFSKWLEVVPVSSKTSATVSWAPFCHPQFTRHGGLRKQGAIHLTGIPGVLESQLHPAHDIGAIPPVYLKDFVLQTVQQGCLCWAWGKLKGS